MNKKDKLQDIEDNPGRHKHYDLKGLISCSTIGKTIDMSIMEAHEGLHGYNNGIACDVQSGPCSCGAWH